MDSIFGGGVGGLCLNFVLVLLFFQFVSWLFFSVFIFDRERTCSWLIRKVVMIREDLREEKGDQNILYEKTFKNNLKKMSYILLFYS